MNTQPRPFCILIAALGGEGGGVLTHWLVQAAMAQDLIVQSTSIPGVAQRTGATTYYIEIFPLPRSQLGGRHPVLALYPGPGEIDIMVASELLETGRALENGYISPQRTTLIGSTHRIYSMTEKTAMADQRYNTDKIISAAQTLAKRALLTDIARLAEQQQTIINAVIFGMIAGSGVLPIPIKAFSEAIRASGVAIEANLRGFQAGLNFADQPQSTVTTTAAPVFSDSSSLPQALQDRVEQEFPAAAQAILTAGVDRVLNYQDNDYARHYLDRLAQVAALDAGSYRLTRETGRYLALWMSFDDVIRVATLKTQNQRLQQVRTEVRAKPDEPLRITEFVKPGINELASLLPPGLGAKLGAWAQRRHRPLNFPMRIKTHTISGFFKLWLLARLRPWRPRSYRFQQEQRAIEHWLQLLRQAAAEDSELALAIAECANLNKGYGETYERGRHNFNIIMEQLVEPRLNNTLMINAKHIDRARELALQDPDKPQLQTWVDECKQRFTSTDRV